MTKAIRRFKSFPLFEALREFLGKVFRLLFGVSTLTFIAYFFLEHFKTGLISNYFDLNLLLGLSLVSGFIPLMVDTGRANSRLWGLNLTVVAAVALALGLLSYQYLQNLEKVRYFIPPLVIASVFFIIYFYQRYDND